MLYIIIFLIYCYLFYRTFKDTDLLEYAENNKSLDILSYYYLIYRRRLVFICNISMVIFLLRSSFVSCEVVMLAACCLFVYIVMSLIVFTETSKIKYDKDGTKISLFLFLKTYSFLGYNIGYDGISYKGEGIYFNPISFMFLCFIWKFYLKTIKKKHQKEKEIKFYKLIIYDLQKEKEKLREMELKQKTEALNSLSVK